MKPLCVLTPLFLSGCILAHPAPAVVGLPPSVLGARTVEFASGSGSRLHAWLAPGRLGAGAVLLLHGVGENRTRMLARARFLHDAGYAVLVPDFQAHGESPGEHITFGARESLDAAAALTFLREAAPGERVGIIGVSMGGAAALLGPGPLAADAVVLESVYPTIREAVTGRMRVWLGPVGFIGPAVAAVVVDVVGAEIGVAESELQPIDHIGAVRAPLLVLAGDRDRYTPLAEARALFARASAPKEFWEVVGAGHVDLHEFAPAEYEHLIGGFFAATLRASADHISSPPRGGVRCGRLIRGSRVASAASQGGASEEVMHVTSSFDASRDTCSPVG